MKGVITIFWLSCGGLHGNRLSTLSFPVEIKLSSCTCWGRDSKGRFDFVYFHLIISYLDIM